MGRDGHYEVVAEQRLDVVLVGQAAAADPQRLGDAALDRGPERELVEQRDRVLELLVVGVRLDRDDRQRVTRHVAEGVVERAARGALAAATGDRGRDRRERQEECGRAADHSVAGFRSISSIR